MQTLSNPAKSSEVLNESGQHWTMSPPKSSVPARTNRRKTNDQSGSVRIIAGSWRGRRIQFPDTVQLRPTPDRVRETLFNWLGQRLDDLSCLDLYAGSGALGFEAASRGASAVTLVESNPLVVNTLRQTVDRLEARQVSVHRADAIEFLAQTDRRFDVVFIDPPYAEGPPIALMLRLRERLTTGAKVYIESDRKIEAPPGWTLLRQGRAGMVHYHLMQAA
jgi:16S rRNA (guanine(966)-N(2))-methyltransferase RsmD